MADLDDRKERLKDLSRRIEDGTYKIDAAAISRAIIHEALEETKQARPVANAAGPRFPEKRYRFGRAATAKGETGP